MGTIKSGILGGFNGKVGSVIGASWKGISYMRGIAQSIKNPKTEAQVMQRDYFAQLAQITAQLSDEQLASLFPNSVKGKTRRNLLQQQLNKCAVADDGVKYVDLSLLESIGNGKKIDTPMQTCEANTIGEPGNETTVILVETACLRAISKPVTANFIVVAYNLTQGKLGVFNTPVTATDANLEIDVRSWAEAGDQVRFYLTYAESGKDVSTKGFGSFIIKTRAEKTNKSSSQHKVGHSIHGDVGTSQLHTNEADR